MSYEITYVDLDRLKPCPFNARLQAKSVLEVEKEAEINKLKEDIKRRGLLQPLVVRESDGKYEVIAGFRRYLALKKIAKEDPALFNKLFPKGIPVIVRNFSDREALLTSLSENLMQRTMNPEEVGASLERAFQLGISLDEISNELQIAVDNLRKALELWWNIKKVRVVPEAKPGRPPEKKIVEPRISRAKIGIASTLAKKLRKKGVVNDERDFAKRFLEATRDLSTSEARIVARRLRENPSLADRLDKVVEEIKQIDYVERIVALRRDIIEFVSQYAKRNGLTFNEALNMLLLQVIKEKKGI